MAKRKPKDKPRMPSDQTIDFEFPLSEGMMGDIVQQLFAELGLPDDDQERKALTRDKNSPLAKAQKLVYRAYETFDSNEQARLARKALKTSPDCVDAYLLLADAAASDDEALELMRQAVAAGERALGEPTAFWIDFKTRPYMRARFDLAGELWTSGQHEESLAHLRGLLRLNPDDHQGVRYILASYLLQLGRDAEMAAVLADFCDDDSTDWRFQRAILAFRREGDTPQARELLQRAHASNAHVAVYMADFKALPMVFPEYVEAGSEEEAMYYTANNRAGWKTTAGALPWMRKVLSPEPPAESETSKGPRRRPRRPVVDFDELRATPQAVGEVWQVDQVSAPINVDDDEEPVASWVWIVVTADEELILDHEVLDEPLSAVEAFERIAKLMTAPDEGEPRRPRRIELRQKSFAKSWTPKLRKIDVECAVRPELVVADRYIQQMLSMVASVEGRGGPLPTYADLERLPLLDDAVWQVDARQIPTWISEGGEPIRPWMLLVAHRTERMIIGQQLAAGAPTDEEVWKTVAVAMVQPHGFEPHRPLRVELSSPALREALLPHFQALGIQCVVRDNLDQIDEMYRDLGGHLTDKSLVPALLEAPGVELEQVADYFAAAADYFRRAPWRQVRGDLAIRLECPKFQTGVWYAVVMGQSGITIGLALYENRDVLDAILSGRESFQDNAREMTGLSLVYGEAFEMSPVDVEACEKFDWPLATSEAYPHAIWLNPGMAIRSPLAWELELLTAALRAVPEFLEQKPKAPIVVQSPTYCGPLEMKMSWVEP